MDILFDASVCEIPVTGVASTTLHLYDACLQLQSSLSVGAVHRRQLTSALPDGVQSCQWARSWSKERWRAFALPAYIALERPRVVHFPWNGNIPRMWTNAFRLGTYHDVIPLAIPECYSLSPADLAWYRTRLQRDLDRTDLVLTVSECSKRDLLKHFRLKHEPVVMYAAQSPEFLPGPDIRSGGSHFIYLGGYDARKGLEVLVPVYDQLYREGEIKVPLILTGTPVHYSPELGRAINQAKEAGAVQERGYVDNGALQDLLHQAKGLIYPSRYEGFGLPVLEAMACGCPVVTTTAGSLPEICGDAAVFTTTGNREELGRAILQLDRNAELRQALRAKGLARAAAFSWSRCAGIFLKALDGVLHETAPRRASPRAGVL